MLGLQIVLHSALNTGILQADAQAACTWVDSGAVAASQAFLQQFAADAAESEQGICCAVSVCHSAIATQQILGGTLIRMQLCIQVIWTLMHFMIFVVLQMQTAADLMMTAVTQLMCMLGMSATRTTHAASGLAMLRLAPAVASKGIPSEVSSDLALHKCARAMTQPVQPL